MIRWSDDRERNKWSISKSLMVFITTDVQILGVNYDKDDKNWLVWTSDH